MCDVVYGIHVDRLERQVLADQQKAAAILAAGGKADEHFPKVWAASFEERQVEFDQALAAAPQARQADTADFLREIGLAA